MSDPLTYRMPNDCIICEYGGWDHVCKGCGSYLGHEMGPCPDMTCVANEEAPDV